MRAAAVGILALVVLIVGLPFAWRPQTEAPLAGANTRRLVVITPHNEQIRSEVERAFRAWHRETHGEDVSIDWRAGSGTSDIERIVVSHYEGLLKQGRMDEGAGYDVLFGGGDYFFTKMKRAVRGEQSVLQPLKLDEALLHEVYPQPDLAGKPLYDPEGQWYGVVLTSFGIVYNRDALRDLGIDHAPATWEDLTDARLRGRVALADPSHSGSVRVSYEAIVQRYGWDRGWATLRRMCANSRYFANSSTKVAIDVSTGLAAAGVCVDFYGRYQSQVVGKERLDYVAPVEATVVTADPVAVMRGANDAELAGRFVRFLLTERGQLVWALRRGEPGGPQRFELGRAPIRRDMYTAEMRSRMVDATDLFAEARPLPPDAPKYFAVIPTVMHSLAMDIQDELIAAWEAIGEEKNATRRSRRVALFDALPFTPMDLAAAPRRWKEDPAAEERDRRAWTAFFRANYRRVADQNAMLNPP